MNGQMLIVGQSCKYLGSEEEYRPPFYSGDAVFGRVRRMSADLGADGIAHYPHRKFMSRAAVLIATVVMPLRSRIAAAVEGAPGSIGIYCAVEDRPVNWATAKATMHASEEQYAEKFRASWPPRWHLYSIPNLVAAHLSILFEAAGPLVAYTHSQLAVWHAFDQANRDLADRRVRYALVCAVSGLEDHAMVLRTLRQMDGRAALCEAAAAVFMDAEGAAGMGAIPTAAASGSYGREFFGIAEPLIRWAQGVEEGQ